MRLRVDQRQLRGAVEQIVRDGEIVLANRDDREIDHGKRLVRLPAECNLEMFLRGIELPIMQLEPGEVDQHADRSFPRRSDKRMHLYEQLLLCSRGAEGVTAHSNEEDQQGGQREQHIKC